MVTIGDDLVRLRKHMVNEKDPFNLAFGSPSCITNIEPISMISDISRISFFYFGGGGVQNIFGKVGVFALREVRGVRGHAPPRKLLKMVQFGKFWRIFC